MNYRVYSDGACLDNPEGAGGWGAVVCREDDRGNVVHLWEVGGGVNPASNNQMELRAALEGLLRLSEMPGSRSSGVRVLTDSKYVIGAVTDWVRGWKRNGWKTSSNQPVKNRDLIEELDQLQRWFQTPPTWVWVKGHAGNVGNENADRIAGRFAIGSPPSLFEGPVGQHPYWGDDRPPQVKRTRAPRSPKRTKEELHSQPLTARLGDLAVVAKKPSALTPPTAKEVKQFNRHSGKSPRKAYFWLLAEKQKGQTLPLFSEAEA
jgi:ribonuclease HI